MWSFTITLTLLLTAASSYGGVVRRSTTKYKLYKGGIDLLSMTGASEAIKRSFQKVGSELEVLASDLEREVDDIAQLSAYINGTETEKMAEALADAINIGSVRRFYF